MKKRIILSIFALAIFLAQGYARTTIHNDENTLQGGMNTTQKGDSVFKAHITNDEFQVWMDISIITISSYHDKRYLGKCQDTLGQYVTPVNG